MRALLLSGWLFSIVTITPVRAEDLTVQFPAPESQGLAAVTWTGSLYVAVGAYGTIMTSPDGGVWTSRNSGTSAHLTAVAWSGTRLVAVGNVSSEYAVYLEEEKKRVVLTSLDGITWSHYTLAAPGVLQAIVWTGSRFVIGGGSGSIFTSADGLAWTQGSAGTGGSLSKMIWTGSQIVAAGSGGVLVTSPDGILWTTRNTGASVFSSITGLVWTGSALVLGTTGGYRTSADGVTWAALGATAPPSSTNLAWTGSRLVTGAGSGLLVHSTNGIAWDTTVVPVNINLAVHQAGGSSFAFGAGGAIMSSPDGVAWTLRRPSTANPELLSLAWTGTQFVAVGRDGAIVTSPNGTAWTARHSGTAGVLWSVTWTGTQLVAVGSANATVNNNTGLIFTSPDGITWTSRTSGTTKRLLSVAGKEGRIVSVGDSGVILTSSDGIAWNTATIQTPGHPQYWMLKSVAAGSAGFVAVGSQGLVVTSPDGITWTGDRHEPAMTPENPNFAANLQHVAWQNGQFITRGGSDVYLSADGTNWREDTTGSHERYPDARQVWNGSIFVSVGSVVVTAPRIPTIAVSILRKEVTPAMRPHFSVQFAASRLLVKVPASLRGPAARATVRSIAGADLTELRVPQDGTLSIPVGHLPRGVYLLEIRNGTARAAQRLTLSR